MKAKGKSKKLIIYENRNTGTLIFKATKIDKCGDFCIISEKSTGGKTLPKNITLSKNTTNETIGEWVRKILLRCK
ncbi:MAG: hypothetical protein CVU78_04625 [Elusimicrobia bacterium HGW-Elusimicrobia-2]|nr:MAG: hypothetical protein CVU78_04625 [Elusimicrobia bacterium HGW-Elusimicrobia-2]